MSDSTERAQFQEAINFLKAKVKLPTSGWTDVWQEQHSHAFVVAGANKDALVEDLYNAVVKSKWAGGGYEDFQEQFPAIAAKHGWAYKGAPGWRSRVIYDTNINQAYNAGRWSQMMAVKHLRPYLQYRHVTIEHPRLAHKAWDGLILPADDPWWNTHAPQNGWHCRCRVNSLSRYEAETEWQKKGKSGPDEAPPIVWEEKVVGKTGANPRTIMTPQGIDPGFAHNPGNAWLEPHTVPPLTGYDAVLKERNAAWPTGFTPPAAPKPTAVPKSAILPPNTPPETAVKDFLDVFGATPSQGVAFTDVSGVTLAVTKALFTDGQGQYKWLAAPGKTERLEFIHLLAMTLIEPDEIWWNWEQDRAENGRWRLKRRYLRAFEVAGTGEYGIVAFEWGRTGWSGSTAFMASPSNDKARLKYFNKQRVGRLMYQK